MYGCGRSAFWMILKDMIMNFYFFYKKMFDSDVQRILDDIKRYENDLVYDSSNRTTYRSILEDLYKELELAKK